MRRPAYVGVVVLGIIGALAIWGISNTRNPLSMPSALGGIAVSQAIWGLKPSNLLMVLPIGSFLVVLARSFIGMKAFGLFTPMLIALAFLQIGPIWGPVVLISSIGIGMVVAPSLLKLRMTRVGFLGVLISLVVFVLAALQGIFDRDLQVDAMPVVVTALCVERWWRQWEKDGYFEAAHIAFNTLALALVIQFVMVSQLALMLIEVSPLLLPGFAAIAITILGRYRGLRMTEIARFFPIWYEGWMQRMGKQVTLPEEADQILAARAEIDKPHDDEAADAAPTAKPSPDGIPVPTQSSTILPTPEALAARGVVPPPANDGAPQPQSTPGRLTAVDWDRIRAELEATQPGTDNAQPAQPAETSPSPHGNAALADIFAARAAHPRLVEPALLGFLYRGGGRDPWHQSAQRDHRQVQSAPGDRTGTRQGGRQDGAGRGRRKNLGHHSRSLRLWSA